MNTYSTSRPCAFGFADAPMQVLFPHHQPSHESNIAGLSLDTYVQHSHRYKNDELQLGGRYLLYHVGPCISGRNIAPIIHLTIG